LSFAGLVADDFAIVEDGKPQTVRYFAAGDAGADRPPMHLGLLLDVSESMGDDLAFSKTAAIKFLNTLTDAVDITVVDFDTEIRTARYSQNDYARLIERIRQKKAAGDKTPKAHPVETPDSYAGEGAKGGVPDQAPFVQKRVRALDQSPAEFSADKAAQEELHTEAKAVKVRELEFITRFLDDLGIKDAKAEGGTRQQTWHYPSRAECMVCHSRAANYVLGLTTLQMNKEHDYGGGVRDQQLRVLEHLGLLRLSYAEELKGRMREELDPDQEGGSVIALPTDPELRADFLVRQARHLGLVPR